jgi:hypothetical protein
MLLCVPSQKGLFFDPPHLHKYAGLGASMELPSVPLMVNFPVTSSGPFLRALNITFSIYKFRI